MEERATGAGDSFFSTVGVACDAGSTLTDLCILNEAAGRMRVARVATTVDPVQGLVEDIAAGAIASRQMAQLAGYENAIGLGDVEQDSHGTEHRAADRGRRRPECVPA